MSDVRPWDIFNKNIEKIQKDAAKQRLDICKACPEFVRFTHQCKKCGCMMDAKTKIADASCPLNKWGPINPVQEAGF